MNRGRHVLIAAFVALGWVTGCSREEKPAEAVYDIPIDLPEFPPAPSRVLSTGMKKPVVRLAGFLPAMMSIIRPGSPWTRTASSTTVTAR